MTFLREGDLSPRELEVLTTLSEGLDVYETAAKLYLSPETIKSHTKCIRFKLDARNTLHAVAIALRQGILS